MYENIDLIVDDEITVPPENTDLPDDRPIEASEALHTSPLQKPLDGIWFDTDCSME